MTHPEQSPTRRAIEQGAKEEWDATVKGTYQDVLRVQKAIQERNVFREALAGLYEGAKQRECDCNGLLCPECVYWDVLLKACDNLTGKLLGGGHEG